jgi:uncharacterized protein DUF6624
MRGRLAVVLALAAGHAAASDPVSAPSPEAGVKCPAAAAWEETHKGQLPEAMLKRDSERSLTKPELLAELRKRADRDQQTRREWLAHSSNRALGEAVNRVDQGNVAWLRELMATRGLPTAAEVGEWGVHLTFLLLQHAGTAPELQQKALPILVQRYEAGELPAADLARLIDRILVEQGKPQRFGTQFDWLSGKFLLPDAARLTEIDANRRQLGLMPLADYACHMNGWLRAPRWGEPPPGG